MSKIEMDIKGKAKGSGDRYELGASGSFSCSDPSYTDSLTRQSLNYANKLVSVSKSIYRK